jgi:hypothetical protein
MLKSIMIMLVVSIPMLAQPFIVEKVQGEVSVQKGLKETWVDVKRGDKLSESDLVSTGNHSYIRLRREGNNFLLKSNAALNLGSIRKISLNDLLLELTREEIKNIPKEKNETDLKSTAVYGADINGKKDNLLATSDLGIKKLNGARQLAVAGYKESSILVARETFRKFPYTQKLAPDRIYFADLLEKLSLYDEAYREYEKIILLKLSESEKLLVKNKIEELSQKLSSGL